MPVILSSEERTRLAKLAGMLGSQFDGERLSALSMIQKMADAKKARIDELLLSGQTEIIREVVRFRDRPSGWEQPKQEKPKQDPPKYGGYECEWKDMLRDALKENEEGRFLSEWELTFTTDLVERRFNSLSEKQEAIVARIREKYDRVKTMRKRA